MRFVKFQALGNDYIVFEATTLDGVSSLNEFAARVCAAHYGAGADGIAVVGGARDTAADFHVRIFNPDGSEAGLSGNGTRCAAAYLYRQGLWRNREVRLQTSARTTVYRLCEERAPGRYVFDSELGRPAFDAASIPMKASDASAPVIDYPLALSEGEIVRVTTLSVGNPHCAIFVDDFAALDWRGIGAQLEQHALFPERTNVEFIRVLDDENIELRIWERGVGETHSSGTCASAAAIASALNNRTRRRVRVTTPGGAIQVEWREPDDVVVLTGRADVVYEGVWLRDDADETT